MLIHGLATLLLAGCSGSDGPERVPLHGQVTRAGASVGRGTISLLPAEGQSGPAATTVIEEGRYEFTRSDGPVAGPHRVVISLAVDEKEAPASPPAPPPGPAGKAASPAKSSARRWELRVDVPEKGPFEHDITLD